MNGYSITTHTQALVDLADTLGALHWYMVASSAALRAALEDPDRYERPLFVSLADINLERLTLHNEDSISWWPASSKASLATLRMRTQQALEAASTLYDAVKKYRRQSTIRNYSDWVMDIGATLRERREDLLVLRDYAEYLYKCDEYGPSILFTPAIWGITRKNEHMVPLGAHSPADESEKTLLELTEVALGLRLAYGGRVAPMIELETKRLTADALADNDGEPNLSAEVSRRVDNEILASVHVGVKQELVGYFERIRNSLSFVDKELAVLIQIGARHTSPRFWAKYIPIALATHSQPEGRHLDFKTTLTIWNLGRGVNAEVKKNAEIEFASDVAAFANSEGGALVIGVSSDYKTIKNFGSNASQMEARAQHAREVLEKCLRPHQQLFRFVQATVTSGLTNETCLVIVVAQGAQPVAVVDYDNRISYPVRVETGKKIWLPEEVKKSKFGLRMNNYAFFQFFVNELRSSGGSSNELEDA